MIEKITTEKIPEWAICYFWNGDIGDNLTKEEVESMQNWELKIIQYAKDKHPRKQFTGLAYDFHDGEGASKPECLNSSWRAKSFGL